MSRQYDVNPSMRAILVDWMTDVCEEYRLNSVTLFLAANFVDRFLAATSVHRSRLQLLGITALFIAS